MPDSVLICCGLFPLIPASLYLLFSLLALIVITRKVLSEKNITHDTIRGGVGIYLLIGLSFTLAYTLLILLDPEAINLGNSALTVHSLLYFSFVTMTTVGFGDIVAVSPFARSLVIVEAVFGQLFLVIFVSRLVGLHIASVKRPS